MSRDLLWFEGVVHEIYMLYVQFTKLYVFKIEIGVFDRI